MTTSMPSEEEEETEPNPDEDNYPNVQYEDDDLEKNGGDDE